MLWVQSTIMSLGKGLKLLSASFAMINDNNEQSLQVLAFVAAVPRFIDSGGESL